MANRTYGSRRQLGGSITACAAAISFTARHAPQPQRRGALSRRCCTMTVSARLRCALPMLSGLLLSACVQSPQQLLQRADALQQTTHQQLADRYPYQRLPTPQQTVVVSDEFYVPALDQASVDKPAWFSQQVQADMRGITLLEALQQLLSPLGVRVVVADEVDTDALVFADHQGTVGELLAWIANAHQLIIEPFAARAEVRQLEVRRFDVSFLSGDTRFMLGDQGQRNRPHQRAETVAGLVPQSQQYLNFASEQLSLWQDLERTLTLMLSERGELSINQSSTSVVVKDTPAVMASVADYIADLNRQLTQQVAIDVQVIEVTFNDREQYAIDWQLLRHIDGIGPLTAAANTSAAAVQSVLSLGLQRDSGAFRGSQVLIDALQQQGQVRISHQPRVLTLNNQVARILVEDETSYLASAGSTSTPNVGTEQLLLPGRVTTGFELFLLPKIQQQQVILQLSSSLSALKGLDTVSSGEQQIQTPRTSRKTFFLKAMVGHRQTLLLSGLQQSRSEHGEQRGLFSWLAGGDVQHALGNSETLLLLTPYIVGAEH
ncbi:hypothetical protein C5610_03750 [Idiomarina sp. OT37-5b]|nr:hypothetical protein C5610_03750 [Idiomarina sp. OT37-5b]